MTSEGGEVYRLAEGGAIFLKRGSLCLGGSGSTQGARGS